MLINTYSNIGRLKELRLSRTSQTWQEESVEMESKMVHTRSGGTWGRAEFNGNIISIWKDEERSGMDCGSGCITVWKHISHWLHT
jgi:hypothetical protein